MLRTAAFFALAALLLYGAWKALPLISGPTLSIDTPNSYTSYEDGFVTISGKAARTEALFLNDAPLFIDTEGAFSTTLLLPPGGAILTLTATDRFGRETSERRVVYTK